MVNLKTYRDGFTAEKGGDCRTCLSQAGHCMDGCIGVWWSNNCIHPSTERCLRLIWESSPSLELKANTAQGTTSFLCTSKGIPGPVSPFSNTAVPIPWTGNCLCKGLMCSLCHWSCVCVLHVMLGLWPAAAGCYALGNPSVGPRFGDPWKPSWNKEKTNGRVVTFLLEYHQHRLLPREGFGVVSLFLLFSTCQLIHPTEMTQSKILVVQVVEVKFMM